MMATETTGLLSGCVVDMPRDRDEYEILGECQKTKSLSLEELMPFQDDPWWQNLRKTFFLSFWITLMLIFLSACILSILQHGSCASLSKNGIPTVVDVAITSLPIVGSVKIPQ